MYFDWTYLVLVMPAVIFSLWASASVKSAFKKYQKQYSMRGITGAQAARMVLDSNGLTYVRIESIGGELTDHYDPRTDVIRLSSSVHDGTSTAAIGVACHEAGHAVQHAEGYTPVKIRTAIVPITNMGSKLAVPLILGGIILGTLSEAFLSLAYIGIICFALSAVFQLVTLPTEFNASRRALEAIESGGILYEDEMKGAKKVLRAAALTYVAALAVSIMQLLRFILLVSGGRRRN